MADARPYIKLTDTVYLHRKIAALEDDRAAWLWAAMICYSNHMRLDGHVQKSIAHRLTASASPRLCQKLVQAGLLEDKGDEYVIHDYLEHQSSAVQIAARSQQARVAGAKGGRVGKRIAKPDAKRNAKRNAKPAAKRHESETLSETPSEVRSTSVPNGTSATPLGGEPPAATHQLIAEYVLACRSRPPKVIVDRMGQQVKTLLAEGIEPDVLRAALEQHRAKPDLSPNLLPALVNGVLNAPAAKGLRWEDQP